MQYRTGAMAEKQLHRLQRVRFPAAASTSGDVGFISDNTGVRLAGRAIENARRLYGSGGLFLLPAPGGCSGTPHGRFESFPEPVRVAVVVDRSAVQSRSESGRGSC